VKYNAANEPDTLAGIKLNSEKTNSDIAALQKALAALEARPVADVDQLTAVKQQCDANARDIAARNAANDRMAQDIADLSRRPADVTGVQAPAAAQAAAGGELDQLRADVDGLTSDVKRLKDTSVEVPTSPMSPTEDGGALNKRLQDVETNLENLLPNFSKQLGDVAKVADERVTAVNADVARQGAQLDELGQDAATLRAAQDLLSSQLQALVDIPRTEGGAMSASDAQVQLLRGTVDGLQKAVLTNAEQHQRDIAAHDETFGAVRREIATCTDGVKAEVTALGTESSNLADQCRLLRDDKASMADVLALKATPAPLALPAAPAVDVSKIQAQFEELRKVQVQHHGRIDQLGSDKADKLVCDQIAAELSGLRQLMKSTPVATTAAAPTTVNAAALGEVQHRIGQMVADAGRDRDWTKDQVVEIRTTIDHIHHTKADAQLVANKAERDYVENALEKLMREVEQVMNSTNAGLIDTLDKSLGILRDMIDGKASKADMAKLRRAGDDGGATVPEGLTGFKSYRCLGCNRTVEAMRTRPMGVNFSNFTNRLPSSPRAVTAATPSKPSSPATEGARALGYITNSAQPATPNTQ
jgi:chromosome segregation ATPase